MINPDFCRKFNEKIRKKIRKKLTTKILEKKYFLIESDLTPAIYAQNILNTVAPVGAKAKNPRKTRYFAEITEKGHISAPFVPKKE